MSNIKVALRVAAGLAWSGWRTGWRISWSISDFHSTFGRLSPAVLTWRTYTHLGLRDKPSRVNSEGRAGRRGWKG